MLGLFDRGQRHPEKAEENHVFDRPEAFMQAPGQGPLRHAQLARDAVGQLLQRAKRAEPAAIGPAPPKNQRCSDCEPQDKGQRIEQERLPAEIRGQRAKERHQVHDRELRIGIPAQKHQRDREKPHAEPCCRPLRTHEIALEKEGEGEDREHRAKTCDFGSLVAPDTGPESGLRRALGDGFGGHNGRRTGDGAQVGGR